MGIVDAGLLIALVLVLVDAYRRGFIAHAADVLVLIPAVYLTCRYWQELADWLVVSQGQDPFSARVAAPLFIYIAIQGLGSLGAFLLCRRLPEAVRTSPTNHWAGPLPALVKGSAYACLVLLVMTAVPNPPARTAMEASRLAPPLVAMGRTVTAWLGLPVEEAVRRSYRLATVPADSKAHDSIAITAVTDEGKLRVESAQEEEMVHLVNGERHRAGAPALREDRSLAEVARAHSRDMWRRGYFAHQDPDGRDVADRVRAAHIDFGLVGENIALTLSLEQAHDGLMHSEGHRRNILDPRFKRVGIGIILNGASGIMVTQVFGD